MASPKDFRILVLDDEVPVREVMTEMLEGAGFTVDGFSSASQALLRLKQTRYDVLVLDLYMPEIPGLLFHSKLKFIDRPLWDRTIFVSGHFSTDDLRQSLEGSARFVAKPFEAETLLATVGLALPDVPRSLSEGAVAGRPVGKPVRS